VDERCVADHEQAITSGRERLREAMQSLQESSRAGT
jgi:hypothetical protein